MRVFQTAHCFENLARLLANNDVLIGRCRRLDTYCVQLLTQALLAANPPPDIGQDAIGDSIQPRQCLVALRDLIDLAPSHQEHLSSSIINPVSINPATAIRVDKLEVRDVDLSKPHVRSSHVSHHASGGLTPGERSHHSEGDNSKAVTSNGIQTYTP